MESIDMATHKVIITLGSKNDEEGVGVQVTFEPEMTGEDYQALGYQPGSHEFLERFIMPVLDSVFMQSEFPELFDEAPSNTRN